MEHLTAAGHGGQFCHLRRVGGGATARTVLGGARPGREVAAAGCGWGRSGTGKKTAAEEGRRRRQREARACVWAGTGRPGAAWGLIRVDLYTEGEAYAEGRPRLSFFSFIHFFFYFFSFIIFSTTLA